METPFKSSIDLSSLTPDVKSYVHQVLTELEPYTLPTTLVTVTAKDPLRLIADENSEFFQGDVEKLKKMWRIAVSLSEDNNKVEEEATHENIFEAIRMAKNKLLKTLSEIQDSAISNQDRTMQINQALDSGELH